MARPLRETGTRQGTRECTRRMREVLIVYLAGVLIGLILTDDHWRRRLLVALAWPLGPLAFVVVVSALLVAACFLWPVRMLVVIAAMGALAYVLI